MLLHMPGGLPFDAPDPAAYCTRAAAIQAATGDNVPVPCPPVLWLAPRSVHLRTARREGKPEDLPHAPLWWTGGAWREFPTMAQARHSQAHAGYVPRKFEPPWRTGAMLRPVEAPLELGLGQESFDTAAVPPVFRLLQLLLCAPGSSLWARSVCGGEWCLFPHQLEFDMARSEAFEVQRGDRYVLLLRGRQTASAGGLDTVLLFDRTRNMWLPPIGPTRSTASGHVGEAPVRWRPVDGVWGTRATALSMKGWLLEATPDYLLLLSPVARDGVQRGPDDAHSALQFFGYDGEVVSHHLACNPRCLSVQRYDQFFLIAKDTHLHVGGEQGDAIMDDDWHPSYPRVAGWLLAADDASVPPLPIFLPSANTGFGASALGILGSARESTEEPTRWSLAIARGNVEEVATSQHMQQDNALRLFLLEDGPLLRIWASRRLDDAFDTLYQKHTLDGVQLVRHALDFMPLRASELEVGSAGGSWLLWSPDLRHTARVAVAGPGSGKLAFWRCAVAYEGETAALRAQRSRACRMAVHATTDISSMQLLPLIASQGWESCVLPQRDARGCSVVSGLPCFPVLRREEGCFAKVEEFWIHPMGRDTALLPPLSTTR